MTVFVDDMDAAYTPPHVTGRRYVLSHMIADTDAELFAMARKIGVARKWYQGDHFDITKSKKALAIKLGAKLIPYRTLAAMANNRRAGLGLGSPDTAEAVMRKRLRARVPAKTPKRYRGEA